LNCSIKSLLTPIRSDEAIHRCRGWRKMALTPAVNCRQFAAERSVGLHWSHEWNCRDFQGLSIGLHFILKRFTVSQ